MSSFIDELRNVNNIGELDTLTSSDLFNDEQWHDFTIALSLVDLQYEHNLKLLNQTINELTADNEVDNTMIIKELLSDYNPEYNMVLAKDISGGYNIKGYDRKELLTYKGKYFKKYCNEIADQMIDSKI